MPAKTLSEITLDTIIDRLDHEVRKSRAKCPGDANENMRFWHAVRGALTDLKTVVIAEKAKAEAPAPAEPAPATTTPPFAFGDRVRRKDGSLEGGIVVGVEPVKGSTRWKVHACFPDRVQRFDDSSEFELEALAEAKPDPEPSPRRVSLKGQTDTGACGDAGSIEQAMESLAIVIGSVLPLSWCGALEVEDLDSDSRASIIIAPAK